MPEMQRWRHRRKKIQARQIVLRMQQLSKMRFRPLEQTNWREMP